MPKHGRRRRSFHLTPERVLLGLPSLWGVLFLLEHFQWLRNGFSVLLALASMGMIVLFLFLWFAAALVFRWRFQFSLRTLCLVMFLACVGMSWVGVKMQQARRQKEAVAAIKELGGSVAYDYGVGQAQPTTPKWLRSLLGDDFLANVVEVWLQSSKVTDVGLEHLKALPQLQVLSLENTTVTDTGLEHLKRLSHLYNLFLDNTMVTDDGLEHLKRLTQLHALSVGNTQVTDEGVSRLQQVLPKCDIIR